MIAAVIAGFTLVSTLPDQPKSPLDAAQACRLAMSDGIVEGRTYSIRATWYSDGIHTSVLELPNCEPGIAIEIELNSPAANRISAFHKAFYHSCRRRLEGDSFAGIFTGHFIQGQSGGLWPPQPIQIFVVRDADTSGENPNLVSCPS